MNGQALLQKLNRDTLEFAFKCCTVKRNGSCQDVFKEPATDPDKNSKRRRLKLVKTDKGFKTVKFEDNGKMLKEYNIEEVIENSKLYL